jgi:PPP family 3-phenylpropionic acid transporter
VRVFAIPLATHHADRHDGLRAALVITAGASALGYGALGLAHGAVAIMVSYALTSAFFTPVTPLTDAYALRGLRHHGRAYGPVRMWGSVAFIAGTMGAGLLLDVIATRHLIWLIGAAMVLAAAAACALPSFEVDPTRRAKTGSAKTGSAKTGSAKTRNANKTRNTNKTTSASTASAVGALLRERSLLAGIAAASLIQASHAVYYGFSALDWKAAGFDGGAIGALWALGVAAEIALFACSGRLAIAPAKLIALGAAGGVLRWGAMALDPPTALLAPLQCLHALSFGATHLGAMGLIMRAVPAAYGATVQGYFAVAQGLAMAGAMGVSGVLYARWGDLAYAAMALAAGAGGILAVAAQRRGATPTRDD